MSENNNLSKRKKLAKLMATGNGIPDLSSHNVDTEELRDYLELLPIGHKIVYNGKIAKISEVAKRNIESIPEDLKQYYINSYKYKRPKTFR